MAVLGADVTVAGWKDVLVALGVLDGAGRARVALGKLPGVAVAAVWKVAEGSGKGWVGSAVEGVLVAVGTGVVVGTGVSSTAVTVSKRFSTSSGSIWLSRSMSPMISSFTWATRVPGLLAL